MATVNPALGTTLSCDFTTPSTYVAIGQILSIDFEPEVGSAETTHLGSTTKTYRPTITDAGEITFEVEYDPGDATAHQKLKALAITPAVHLWKITYADSGTSTDVVNGFLTKMGRSAGGPEDNLTASFTVKCTGAVT
jgi:Lambda phage tail tube protein, TTP